MKCENHFMIADTEYFIVCYSEKTCMISVR